MEDQTHLRDLIINQIPDTIHNLLQEVDLSPIRILGDTPNSLLDSRYYLESIQPFISQTQNSIHHYRPDIETRFLAVNTTHTDTTPIPIYVLRLSRKKISITRQQRLDATIAERLRAMHNGHGDDPLPLLDDFNQTVEYHSPRSLRR
ncbi:unnamed protein product [Penicillium salamii]|uniref:Uncharacterized protein n=1 Tax=Penicillium salamii TaxID=1612424 RepID=A0A9W4JA88_9EURO|nr:unnamed protein product [Penicillium salamii]